ncbi:MAG: hypothetical protein ACI4WV_04825 [Eubacteriales bacterium]
MTREDAFCEQIKLSCGFGDSYDQWLAYYLETEDPLSDIVLALLDCGDNMKEIERCLNLYCLEKPFDANGVYEKLRLELHEKYMSGAISKGEVATTLFRFSLNIPFCSFQDCCSILSDYYELAEKGMIDMERYDMALQKFLAEGGEIDTDAMWGEQTK